ncbi:cathepsin L-like isoform X3 [Penaeus japonicus]|uniref:cathepsin L-like isoform X3 n=1 Tax=Penaeus japonicus TaxID=27405 RepID=UPI001C7134E5|nr:cathepsin L-like isoform X3 [Penaeus japonicus]
MRLILVVCALSSAWVVDAQLLRYEGKIHFGTDGHDQQPHSKILLGSDGHDQKPHGQKLLGVDGHDQRLHSQALLGGDGHDQRQHSQALLGADGHDLRSHGQKHFGVDGHDQQPHGQMLLGADGHDQRPHHQTLLGADGHDQHPHTQTVLGGDGHDQRSHGQTLLGEDGHDQRNHKETLLGGDGHDQGHHGQTLLGADGHDMRAHSQKLLGQDGHDQRPHSQVLLGGDGHDQQPHGQVGNGPRELSHTHMFKGFMKKYNKAYNSQSEFKKRFSIFRQNLKKIHILQQSERGTAKYGPTKFSDLTEHEFRRMLGLRPDLKPTLSQMEPAEIPSEEIPSSFDWRDHGIVTPVKNQGMCGSCWAFSVTGNVEGQWALKHKHLYSLSEQELVDCDKTDEGCNGGMPENAYEAIAKLGGLETENDYPYEAKDDQCHFNETKVKVTVNGSVELPQNEDDLARWLVKHGPISIGINANALQFYVGGVSHPLRFLCNPKSLDHGMLIVGYGVHTTKYLHRRQPYWIVKNSWGPDWGEQGYYRVYRGDGTCGVNQMATSAIVP